MPYDGWDHQIRFVGSDPDAVAFYNTCIDPVPPGSNYTSRGGLADYGSYTIHNYNGGSPPNYAIALWLLCKANPTEGGWVTDIWSDGVSILHQITVNTSPVGLDAPTGAGKYAPTETVWVNVSDVAMYTFDHWNKDGLLYSGSRPASFYMDSSAHTFTAVFLTTPGAMSAVITVMW
jgi:hypothetical protein